jgi:hypothetical protein
MTNTDPKIISGYVRRFLRGQFPACVGIFFLRLRYRKPQTFDEKIKFKMAWDRRELLTKSADKLEAREIVAELVGNRYLSNIYAIDLNEQEFRDFEFPKNFVIKPNHASGAAIIVWDKLADTHFRFPKTKKFQKYFVSSNDFFPVKAFQVVKKWTSNPYFNCSQIGYPEWAYKNIKPRFYIEELLTHNQELPRDFRFFIFDGKCEIISVDSPGINQVMRNIYDRDWTPLDASLKYPNWEFEDAPAQLDEMLSVAEKLGSLFDHIRVDLYLAGKRIVFGELTNYHSGGTQRFAPNHLNRSIGRDWDPTVYYGPNK